MNKSILNFILLNKFDIGKLIQLIFNDGPLYDGNWIYKDNFNQLIM